MIEVTETTVGQLIDLHDAMAIALREIVEEETVDVEPLDHWWYDDTLGCFAMVVETPDVYEYNSYEIRVEYVPFDQVIDRVKENQGST